MNKPPMVVLNTPPQPQMKTLQSSHFQGFAGVFAVCDRYIFGLCEADEEMHRK
jgi:hypothetical protein